MKKIAMFLLFTMITSLLVPAVGISADVVTIPETPTPISTLEEFESMNGVPGNYYLTGDIDFAGKVYEKHIIKNFDGILDGCGYKLYNFSINHTAAGSDAAMIGVVGATHDSTIKNLNVGSADVPIKFNMAAAKTKSLSPFVAVVGNNDFTTNNIFENVNVFADATITIEDPQSSCHIGGMVAFPIQKPTILFKNCSFNGSLKCGVEDSEGNSYRNVGGFVGTNKCTEIVFEGCTNNADITLGASFKEARASGFVAYTAKPLSFTNCINNGKISVLGEDSDANVSGFVSDLAAAGTFTGCVNNGEINGNWFSGGIVTIPRKTVTLVDCTNNGNIIGREGVSASIAFLVEGVEAAITNFTNTVSDVRTDPGPIPEETTAEITTEKIPDNEETEETEPNETTDKPEDATVPDTVDGTEKGGCGSMICGSAVIIALIGTVCMLKKREN